MAKKSKDLGNKERKKVSAKKQKKQKKESNDPKVEAKSRPFTIYSMSEKKQRSYLKGILYGEYGVGKTTLGASAVKVPEMQDVLYISVESGDMSIRHLNKVDLIEPTTFQQFAQVHKFLRKHCKYRDMESKKGNQKLLKLERHFKNQSNIEQPKKYYTVVIDSLSEVQKLSMYKLLGINLNTYTLDIQPDRPEYAEWNTSTEYMRLLVRLFRNLPMNVIAVCGPRIDENERKQRIYSPAMSKALSKEIQGFVDFVGFLVAGKSSDGKRKRRLWLEPGDTYAAKNRFASFNKDYLDDPTMYDLWKIINE